MSQYKIVILGAGNVGYQLARHLRNSGHQVIQVFSRHLPIADWMGNLMEIPYTDKLYDISLDGDIYLLCVKDDAIVEVTKQLRLGDKIIAHTSGSAPLKILEAVSSNYGVFYPLQTFSIEVPVDFSTIPVCIDASNEETLKTLRDLAQTLTGKIVEVNDEKRLAIHVAAVFANNFTNHLFSIAEMILEKDDLSFEILKPLIGETIRKIQDHDPLKMQTGPAVRHDEQTIERHLQFLTSDDRFAALYKLLTEDIQRWK